jgi:uncharacterized protein (TIGR02099 family)
MKRLWRAIEVLAWSAFFALAVLVLAMRFWLLPDIERYRDHIVAAVARTVGQPVRIGGIEAGWLGLNPRIHLNDVRIYDREGREALVLPSVENVLAWSSLVRGELKLHSLAIEGLRLQVRRDAAGALYVAGSRLGGDSPLSDWVLGQDEIVIRNAEIEWHDEKRAAPPLVLSALNLRIRNAGDEHSIGFTAHPPAALGSTVELRAVLDGRTLSDPGAWSGRLYAELGYTDLAAWRAWLDYPLELDRGQGALRLWVTLERGELKQATADVALAQLAARLGKELAPVRLASLQGRLQGKVEGHSYQLSGRGVAFAVERGPSIAPSDFQVSWTPGSDGGGAIVASAIDLEPLAHLAASLPFPVAARKMLAEIRPRGRLSATSFEWTGLLDAPTRFNASAQFAHLAADPSGQLPGFSGISGTFYTTEQKGRVQLASRKSELHLPRVFPQQRIALDFLDGQVEWEREGQQGFAVRLSSVSFSNEHFSGNAHGAYSYAGSGPGIVDLSAQFNRADAAHLAKYLPHGGLMGSQARRDWLVSAVVAGQSGDVRVRIQGDLRDFPFSDPLRGQFSVLARIEKGVLNYANGWPRIQDISADLVFERDRMEIVGRGGSIQGVALANVRVAIPRLGDRNALLAVTGQAEGATADFFKFIAASPVRRMVSGLTDPMSASGRGKLRLKLDLPLQDPPKTRVAGEYEFAGNNVVVHPQLPAIDGAVGKVGFTESTVTLHDVHGRLFGGAVEVSGGTRADGSVHILAKGEATVAGVRPLFDHPWQRYLSGASPYVATVDIAQGRMRIGLESSLRGIESSLPAPLAKSAAESLPLRLYVVPAGADSDRVSVVLERIAAVDFQRRRQGEAMVVQRTAIALTPTANPALRLPQRPGTLVYGSLAALDLDKWLPLFARGEGAGEAAFDVRIGVLDVYGKRINGLTLRGAANAGGWSAHLNAQELAGDVAYRNDAGGRVVARLTHFRLPEDYPGAQPSQAQPKDLPSMDLVTERFTYRGKELGRVELMAQRVGDDWRIDKLGLNSADGTLTGSGAWRSGAPARSSLDFELHTSDAGQFLARVGYPDVVKGGKAQLKGSLTWNGELALIDYPSLTGDVQLRAESGQFLEIEPGFGKLISLMSLQSLPRRITLDFRDVFSKGFEFERISSSGQVERGVMAVKDFRMRGSGAQVEMSGDVNLAAETQNLRVRVVPSLGDSAATVIGLVNPLLAIPAAIAQKILRDPLGNIFAFDYSVSGGWTDPQVVKLGIEAREIPPGQ